MPSINTNLGALTTQQDIRKSTTSLATSMDRLSSGLRVNGAKDDAAGLGIANRMETNLRANSAVSRGINDGIALMQTAEGGLDGINGLLQRSRELAVQAANGTLSDSDRASINAEYKELREEIDRIAMGTEAFGKYPLAPTEEGQPTVEFPSSVESLEDIEEGLSYRSGIHVFSPIPEGTTGLKIIMNNYSIDDDIQVFTLEGKHLAGVPVGTSTWKSENNDGNPQSGGGIDVDASNIEEELFVASGKFSEDAVYDDEYLNSGGLSEHKVVDSDGNEKTMKIIFSGDNHANGDNTETLEIDEVVEPLLLAVTGSGSFKFDEVTWDQKEEAIQNKPNEGIDIVTSATFGDKIDKETIPPAPSDSASLGLEDVELDPIEKAREALTKLQEAMNQVDGYRGKYGALQNRFESAIENLATQTVNTAAAQSRIMDADYAKEASAMVKSQILQQAGHSMLSQANQVPQSVLGLLESS